MATTQHPKTETKTVSETRQHFSETLNRVYRGETRVLVEKSGIPVGVIVSPRDLETLNRIDEEMHQALQALAEIQSGFEDIPEDELEREVSHAIVEAKQIRRQERERSTKKTA